MEKIKNLRRRTLVRIVSYMIAVMIALGGFVAHGYFLTVRYRTQLEYTYQRALNDLSDYLSSINIGLKKGLYSTTVTQLSRISSELWRDSGSAQACLAQMPTADEDLYTVGKFLSQVGEYSVALTNKVIAGEKITDKERENLTTLSGNATELSAKVSEMQNELSEGRLWLGEVRRVIEKSDTDSEVKSSLSDGMKAAEEIVAGYPTLIYDGPFSDHLINAEAELLKGGKEVTVAKAREVAQKHISGSVELEDWGEENSASLPAFVFGKGDIRCAVSKIDGVLVYMNNSRDISEHKLSFDEALQKAQEYLKSHGLTSFGDSYYMTNEGVCVINFAYLDGEVMCYPDLVKVGVALDNGEIVSIDCRGYVMNHKKRDLTGIKHTAADALEIISEFLSVENVSTTLIPKKTGTEKLCYEFACKTEDDEDILVYVGADSLQEEEILILLKVDGGVMTF